MPNLNAVLGEEIRRLARKEIKIQTKSLSDAVSRYRTDIAALKKQNRDLERRLNKVAKGRGAASEVGQRRGRRRCAASAFQPRVGQEAPRKAGPEQRRTTARWWAWRGLTIYNWEKGVFHAADQAAARLGRGTHAGQAGSTQSSWKKWKKRKAVSDA